MSTNECLTYNILLLFTYLVMYDSCDSMDHNPPDSSVHGISRQEYWSGCYFLLQGIFPTQRLNTHVLHWQADSLSLSHQGSPYNILLQSYHYMVADSQHSKFHIVHFFSWVFYGHFFYKTY